MNISQLSNSLLNDIRFDKIQENFEHTGDENYEQQSTEITVEDIDDVVELSPVVKAIYGELEPEEIEEEETPEEENNLEIEDVEEESN